MISDRQSRSARIALEANRLGEPLKGLRVPQEVVSQIVTTLRNDQQHSVDKVSAERSRLEARLTGIRNRMDGAYTDKLDGKIPEDFWERRMADWRREEQQVKMAIQGLSNAEVGDRALDAQRIFELANKAYSLICFAESGRKGQIAQNAIFELLCRCRKCNAHIQKAL